MNVSIRRFATAVLAATGLVVGIGASAASATPFLASSLSVVAIANNDFILRVSGHIEMSQADAQAACAHPGDPVDVQLYGQDAGVLGDDELISKAEYGAATMTCTTNSTGLNYVVSVTRDGDVLNEDRPGDDELYAYVTFLDIRTGTTHVDASNVVTRNF
ncbi:MAG TPA: hypothetical protein VM942_09410 [Acidimicrobiales bacterium]|nr:hypothetical protein [Acidimicrobiales bacterium]